MAKDFYQQLGTGISTATFAVGLAVFILAAAFGVVNTLQGWLLFAVSFLIMLRFWFRYSELFVRFLPSKTYWQFVFDFLVAFFGILAVLSVGNIQTWALLGALAMISSAVRCGMSWKESKKDSKPQLKQTLKGSTLMLIIFAAVYLLAPFSDQLWLAASVLVLVMIFVIYGGTRKGK